MLFLLRKPGNGHDGTKFRFNRTSSVTLAVDVGLTPLVSGYCVARLGRPCAFVTAGGAHFPVSASDFGPYRRMVRLNDPLGAGSQLASLSLPRLSFWKEMSSEPSRLVLNGIQLL